MFRIRPVHLVCWKSAATECPPFLPPHQTAVWNIDMMEVVVNVGE